MINSNYYACDFLGKLLNPRQVSRAAVYIHGAMIMKKEIEDETLKPLIINKLIPLCSSQYKRLFGTCRIPGEAQDTLLHVSGDGSNNVVVYRCGRWYKMAVYHRKRLLNPAEIEWQLQQIIDDDNKESVYPGEEHLPALTASDRTYWADVRNKFFSTGINKQYMNDIEKSPFFLNLDNSSPEVSLYGDDVNDKLYKYCTGLLHGDGYKFWFDKSISCIVYSNGRVGVNAEHSWADAPIVGHMLEYISNLELPEIYNDDGTCVGEVKAAIKPQRMKWDISEAVSYDDLIIQ
jgi:carnitine O-palmitoyltransferase 1